MEKFLIPQKRFFDDSSTSQPEVQSQSIPNVNLDNVQPRMVSSNFIGSNSDIEEINLSELESDPGLRKPIYEFHPNQVEKVRRAYLQRGPCQPPENHVFPQTLFGKDKRQFSRKWFNEFPKWLEYSVKEDAGYCLCCYLFTPKNAMTSGGVAFVNTGFRNWKHKDKLNKHVGGVNSRHINCMKACDDLLNHEQHIEVCFSDQSETQRLEYRVRLKASVDCLKYLLRQGLVFRGHDETEDSHQRGNFLELLNWLAKQKDEIGNVVLKSAPENNKITSPHIQKDIISACANITINKITKEIRSELFSLLVDESRDCSLKEQMAIVLRYVDKKGCVVERFVGIIHVSDTSSLTLKKAIDSFFAKHDLSLSSLRGQGYDGASNMKGEFNGLKALILRENPSSFYVHCFAHQLQLTIIAVSKKIKRLSYFFDYVTQLTNIVGSSCKRKDLLRDKQYELLVKGISDNEIITGSGLNQEMSIRRAGDTRWGSHLSTLCSMINLFSPVISVLKFVEDEYNSGDQGTRATDISDRFQTFEFIFIMHMMKSILGITNELSFALQRKDQDIVNAMDYVKVSKSRLTNLRNNEWDTLLGTVSSFCNKHEIAVPDMKDQYVEYGRPRRNVIPKDNFSYYHNDLLLECIDLLQMELNDRFNEINSELILCMACLNPSNSFAAFDVEKLVCFAKFYPADFSSNVLMILEDQLRNFFADVTTNLAFRNLRGIGELAQKLVATNKHIGYPSVYKLIKLALILPVATAGVERTFSAMKVVKNLLRNRMGDELMNDCLVTYIEHEIFNNIEEEEILQYFQSMKTRRILL